MVAEDLYRHLRSTTLVKSAENLVVFLNCYPSVVGAYMGWSVHDVDKARDLLFPTLRGHVDDRLLDADYDISAGMTFSLSDEEKRK